MTSLLHLIHFWWYQRITLKNAENRQISHLVQRFLFKAPIVVCFLKYLACPFSSPSRLHVQCVIFSICDVLWVDTNLLRFMWSVSYFPILFYMHGFGSNMLSIVLSYVLYLQKPGYESIIPEQSGIDRFCVSHGIDLFSRYIFFIPTIMCIQCQFTAVS